MKSVNPFLKKLGWVNAIRASHPVIYDAQDLGLARFLFWLQKKWRSKNGNHDRFKR